MLKSLFAAALAVGLGTAPAMAARTITVTWTGTIASGTDNNGLFGAAGTNVAGLAFSSVTTYDLSKMDYQPGTVSIPGQGIFDLQFFSSYTGGTSYGGAVSPIISSSFAVNGQSLSIAGNFGGNVYAKNDPLMIFGTTEVSQFETGLIDVNAGVDVSFVSHRITQGLDLPWGDLGVGDYDGDVSGASSNSSSFQHYNYATQALDNYTLSNQHLTIANAVIASVPEPANWALMIGGFGFVGATMRARRVRVRFAAA